MQQNDIQTSAYVLSVAMLDHPSQVGVFMVGDEKVRLEIEKMFFGRFNSLPGVVFLAKKMKISSGS